MGSHIFLRFADTTIQICRMGLLFLCFSVYHSVDKWCVATLLIGVVIVNELISRIHMNAVTVGHPGIRSATTLPWKTFVFRSRTIDRSTGECGVLLGRLILMGNGG